MTSNKTDYGNAASNLHVGNRTQVRQNSWVDGLTGFEFLLRAQVVKISVAVGAGNKVVVEETWWNNGMDRNLLMEAPLRFLLTPGNVPPT